MHNEDYPHTSVITTCLHCGGTRFDTSGKRCLDCGYVYKEEGRDEKW